MRPEVLSSGENPNDIAFKQEEVTPHYTLTVQEWLDEHLSEKWIEVGGLDDCLPEAPI